LRVYPWECDTAETNVVDKNQCLKMRRYPKGIAERVLSIRTVHFAHELRRLFSFINV